MAYLNSNSPLFSRVRVLDLREFIVKAMEPKLMSLTGDIANLRWGRVRSFYRGYLTLLGGWHRIDSRVLQFHPRQAPAESQ